MSDNGLPEVASAEQPAATVQIPGRFAELFVEHIEIRNFRGITSCDVDLEPDLTVLVGRNNSGKSRVLRALGIGLSGVAPEVDDLTVGEASVATIDIVVAPLGSDESGVEHFDEGVAQRLVSVQEVSEDPSRERFAWRTTIQRSEEGFGVRAERQVLVFDSGDDSWKMQKNPETLSRDQASLVATDLVETHRDLAEELNRRATPIRRVLSDLEVDPTSRAEIESGLIGIGEKIVESSGSLAAVREALNGLQSIAGIGVPALQPLPVRVEELARSVSIDIDSGNGPLPIRLHGAGSRGLASLQIQGVLYDRRLGRDGKSLRPHPVSLIEEPEAHLHPQAQFELVGLLSKLRGQVVVTSHSAHLASSVDPCSLRLLRPSAADIEVIDFHSSSEAGPGAHRARRLEFHLEEMEKLRRQIERPFGELLFASAVVLGDGATERALLPPMIRGALGNSSQGVCVVDPGSMSGALAIAVVKFAKLVGIPWLLFSDSDNAGRHDAGQLVEQYGDNDESLIVWVGAPDTTRQDGRLIGSTEQMLIHFDEQLCVTASEQLGYTGDGILAFMGRKKGSIGALIAREIIAKHQVAEWPGPVRDLITRLSALLGKGVTS